MDKSKEFKKKVEAFAGGSRIGLFRRTEKNFGGAKAAILILVTRKDKESRMQRETSRNKCSLAKLIELLSN